MAVALNQQFIHTYGANTALKAGMLLDADIYLDRRSPADWLLDPLKALAAKQLNAPHFIKRTAQSIATFWGITLPKQNRPINMHPRVLAPVQ